MKRFFLPALILLTLPVLAQMKEGRIVYERVFKLPIRNFNTEPAVLAQIPKTRTDQFELLFGNNQSLWQYLPNANNENDGTYAGGGVVMRFNTGATDVTYCNFDKGIRIDQREFAERNYVVSDSLKKQTWKLSEETKTILNYTVRKATSQRISTRMKMSMENGEVKRIPTQDTSFVIAWFTTDIPVSAGPDFPAQLPGIILELDIANGQNTYKAIEISPKVSLNKLKEPKEGKKMTASEFTKEREKIMEEMRKNMPSGNTIRIQN